jgi:hypothetical protein
MRIPSSTAMDSAIFLSCTQALAVFSLLLLLLSSFPFPSSLYFCLTLSCDEDERVPFFFCVCGGAPVWQRSRCVVLHLSAFMSVDGNGQGTAKGGRREKGRSGRRCTYRRKTKIQKKRNAQRRGRKLRVLPFPICKKARRERETSRGRKDTRRATLHRVLPPPHPTLRPIFRHINKGAK